MRRLFIVTAAVMLVSSAVRAETPPAGSPADLGQWPRLIVTQANRQATVDYINAHYRTQFQSFLNKLGAPPGPGDPEIIVEGVWGPANYAFPVALGVNELKASGYTFPAAYDTDAKLCGQAYAYWSTDITDGTGGSCTPGSPCRSPKYQLENSGTGVRSFDRSASVTTYTMRATTTWYYLPSLLMFDWCHDTLTTSQRQAVANAFYEAYSEYWAGENLLSTAKTGTSIATTSSSFPFVADDVLFALTAWGDTEVLDASKRQTLYDTFHALYPDRYFWELRTKWPEGWQAYYGSDYWAYTVGVGAPPVVAMINTALGTPAEPRPYADGYKQFREIGTALSAWSYPEFTGKATSGCGAGATTGCIMRQEPWGDNTFGYNLATSQCRSALLSIGFLRFMGYHDEANRARWFYDNHVVNGTTMCSVNPDASPTTTTTLWANALFYYFLFGTAGTTAIAPTEKNVTLGWYYHLFRKDYTPDDTYVFFGAQPYLTGGHDSKELGSFTLRKFGPLLVKGGNWREGNCRINLNGYATNNLLRNTVGIHTGSSDPDLGYDGGTAPDPDFAARGIGGVINQASLPPLRSFGSTYSYVSYDGDPMWTLASKYQREFAYLRGSTDHEYLVVLDRVNVSDTANDPIWKVWTVAQPACVDAACSNPRPGKWTTSGRVISVTNSHPAGPAFGSPAWDRPAANGKFFLKALLPADASIRMLGDDGSLTKMFQHANDDGTTIPFVQSSCMPQHQELFGWGRIEVRPTTVQTANTFLNVMQFGSASTLSSMAQTDSVDTDDGNFVVARIFDSERNRLVVFAKNAATSPNDDGFTYTYLPTTSESDHLIVNLAKSATYYVSVSGSAPRVVSVRKTPGVGAPATTDVAGTLAFQAGESVVFVVPRAPINVRVVAQ